MIIVLRVYIYRGGEKTIEVILYRDRIQCRRWYRKLQIRESFYFYFSNISILDGGN